MFTNFKIKNTVTVQDYGFSDHSGVMITIPGYMSKGMYGIPKSECLMKKI